MIEIYTDGSYDTRTRHGGWAFVVFEGGSEALNRSGLAIGHSSNSLEVLAVLQAALWARAKHPGEQINIWTDSFYVMEGVRRWLPIWRNNGWKKFDPNPRNRRRAAPDHIIWQSLDAELARTSLISIEWCKGHVGLTGNDRVDQLANVARASIDKLGSSASANIA